MAEVKVAPKTQVAKGQGQATALEPRASTLGYGIHPAFMRRFAEEVDQLFEDFGLRLPGFFGRGRELLRREVGLIPAEWSPRIEILQKDGNLVVRADLPGIAKEDIKVEITEDRLTIQGERSQEKMEEREGYAYNECSYGSFYRAIPLPEGVETSKATAEFRNGVLEIAMPTPRLTETQARHLEIQETK
jgi:HSP20 family protein